MRPLLVCAAAAPGAVDLVATLARDADLVIAVDGGGALCLAAGVVPDVLVGDLDSLSAEAAARIQAAGAEVVRFPAEKDASDLELALGEARTRGATRVVVTAAASGRLDHTLAALATLAAAADLAPRLVEPTMSAWVLSPSGRDRVALSGEGSTLSIVAWGGGALVSATGVHWPLDRALLEPTSTRGLSNVVAGSKRAVIVAHEGIALVITAEENGLPTASEA